MRVCLLLLTLYLAQIANSQGFTTDSVKVLSEVTIIGEKEKFIPGSGKYIGSHKISKLNQPNINNILRLATGVNIRDEEGFGLRPNIGLRGTPVNRSAKITLMEDGILIAPAPYADPSAYYFPTFARMHGVEVLKGSSQVKHGPYTIGGAINLISTPIPDSFKGFAQISFGSFGTNQQRVWIGDSRKNFDYVFEVNRLASNGFKQLNNDQNTGFDRRDMMGKLRWHTDESKKTQQTLTLKLLSTTETGNESYLGLTFEDYQINPRRRYAATQRDLLDMNHNHLSLSHSIIPNKNIYINTSTYYATTFRDWARVNSIRGQSLNAVLSNPTTHKLAYDIMTGTIDGNIDYQSAARNYNSQGIQSNIQYFFNTKSITHKFQLGVRYHEDQADRFATRSLYSMTNGIMALRNAGIKGNQENQIREAKSQAVFLNYDITKKGLKVTPGIRFERINFAFENYGNSDEERQKTNLRSATNALSIVAPGVGFNYKLHEQSSVFGGVHKGFSPPGMPSLTTEKQAKVETAINYELGYRLNKRGFNIELAGFYSNYENISGSDNVSGGGAGTGDLFNAGNAVAQGVELSLDYDLFQIFQENIRTYIPFSFAYTYTHATFQETFINSGGDWGSGKINRGDFIPFITPHLLTASLGFENKRLNATIFARYTGLTRTRPGQNGKVIPSSFASYNEVNAINDFIVVDFSANYKLRKGFTFFTTINNLTNTKAIVANLPNGYRPNIPLSYNAGLKKDF